MIENMKQKHEILSKYDELVNLLENEKCADKRRIIIGQMNLILWIFN